MGPGNPAGCHIGVVTAIGHDTGDDGDQREASLVEREAVLAAQVTKYGADRAARAEAAEKVCAAAKERDVEADARDRLAAAQDHAADVKAFTSPAGSGYGADLPARRHAALDRRDAKSDRTSSADDRATLTEVLDDPQIPEEHRPE